MHGSIIEVTEIDNLDRITAINGLEKKERKVSSICISSLEERVNNVSTYLWWLLVRQ